MSLTTLQIRPFTPFPIKISRHAYRTNTKLSFKALPKPLQIKSKSHETHHDFTPQTKTQEDGIPIEDVKIIAKFKSGYNYIRVLEISRKADHPFAGSRLLLLDAPGNIHSISFLFKSLTNTYFDGVVVHGWELDPSVIDVGREFFGLKKLEKQYPDRLFIYVGNALSAEVKDGFSGILVDLFCKGSLIPELQDPNTWEKLRKSLRKDGRIMVNVGGSCVEAEDKRRDGKVVMEDTLKAMHRVFGDRLSVLNLGNRKDDSSLALTGRLPDLDAWKKVLPISLTCYVDMWRPLDP
ncbi:SAM-DEPENDENT METHYLTRANSFERASE SUPERFAMILY PROTEIN [Salix viminalis]|uniref:SAM-DEPENDENT METHYLTRANSFERASE SUPERFAMILY PROTEIN n=1 Tax=Salix viminalis TaxID=40686 RepID=A0A9Q0NVD6_SALVM|nr:SAM-DEPENDENT METHYLTRANSFERASE SUPERFAMILY PROTEIN [Salix viminalis]